MAGLRAFGRWFRRVTQDPRNGQIAVLATLVLYGTLVLDFVAHPLAIPVTLGVALLLERLLFPLRGDGRRTTPPYRSALISGLSTLLLFRSTEVWAYAVVIVLAIASKANRIRGRHFINPANGAVLIGSLLLPGWIASGQWGHETIFIFALAAAGSLVLSRAQRLDSAVSFLLASLACQLLRHFVLGYGPQVIGHHFRNGALWLFALYMITDPRTTPTVRSLRIVHAVAVAALGTALAQFFYVRDSFLWALLVLAPVVPLFDFISRDSRSGGLNAQDQDRFFTRRAHARADVAPLPAAVTE